ncbi:hypothetical protein E4O03_01805 [Treponema sp. OMZ 792]|uniref:hypothetical protein n=1 Tax=unclassified Treponema TaxID=2638727 RepID=UPI0020A322CC|nr:MULTISPECIES: hypothetical protein [unclassified Treponema]UTC75490.1 hypothetical protein E4O03_01805 [Treponema sp. OMZ 792]UTC78709.1 hypothetical protein E4O04_12190 [Treponema sp. OMZ 799]UTC79493.1 hypothetical protein E4O07_01820 [Treponema sp. OMZ 798]
MELKKNSIKIAASLICCIGLMVLLNSCLFLALGGKGVTEGEAGINGEQVKLKDLVNSDKECLVYGYLNVGGFHTYAQMDTSKEPMLLLPKSFGGGVFAFPPMDKGLSFQLLEMNYSNWFTKTTTNFTPGLGRAGNITFITKKTGLQFIGAYDFIISGSTASLSLYPREEQSKYELKCLNKMKSKFKNTKWEAFIDKRIKEIENEK